MNTSHYETVKNTVKDKAQLCIVTKRHTVDEIMPFYDLGERIFAENRADELIPKAEQMPKDIQWHYIGHLQRNKVRKVLPYVSMIQSLDSIGLADVLEKEAARIDKVIPVLAEFHLASEDTNKSGLGKEDAKAFFDHCQTLDHIKLEGIMVMGPHTDDKERIAEVFNDAYALFKELQETYGEEIRILSMGMSADYPIAVACGSTMVRIGTYLFQ